MFSEPENEYKTISQDTDIVRRVFDDFEARSNFVGFFDLAFKVAKRNPTLWADISGQAQPRHD